MWTSIVTYAVMNAGRRISAQGAKRLIEAAHRLALGPAVADTEVLRDSHGRVVDDAYIDAAVEDAVRTVRDPGRRDRPRSCCVSVA